MVTLIRLHHTIHPPISVRLLKLNLNQDCDCQNCLDSRAFITSLKHSKLDYWSFWSVVYTAWLWRLYIINKLFFWGMPLSVVRRSILLWNVWSCQRDFQLSCQITTLCLSAKFKVIILNEPPQNQSILSNKLNLMQDKDSSSVAVFLLSMNCLYFTS